MGCVIAVAPWWGLLKRKVWCDMSNDKMVLKLSRKEAHMLVRLLALGSNECWDREAPWGAFNQPEVWRVVQGIESQLWLRVIEARGRVADWACESLKDELYGDDDDNDEEV